MKQHLRKRLLLCIVNIYVFYTFTLFVTSHLECVGCSVPPLVRKAPVTVKCLHPHLCLFIPALPVM